MDIWINMVYYIIGMRGEYREREGKRKGRERKVKEEGRDEGEGGRSRLESKRL